MATINIADLDLGELPRKLKQYHFNSEGRFRVSTKKETYVVELDRNDTKLVVSAAELRLMLVTIIESKLGAKKAEERKAAVVPIHSLNAEQAALLLYLLNKDHSAEKPK